MIALSKLLLVRKRRPYAKRFQYDRNDLLAAIKAVIGEGLKIQTAAKMYKVPRTTLTDNIRKMSDDQTYDIYASHKKKTGKKKKKIKKECENN